MGPAYKKLESGEAIAAAKEAAEGALLLAYIASDTSKEFNTFAEVAEALRNGEGPPLFVSERTRLRAELRVL